MTLSLGKPNEKQKIFLKSRVRHTCYGGARGGGKSWVVRAKAVLLAMRYGGIKMLLLRKTYPELRENHIRPLTAMLKGAATYKETEKAFLFPNGSILKLGYLDSDRDVLQYQGQEYDVIFMDEATHFTEYMYNTLTACLRGANSFPKRFYLTCNPGGIGHAWVKRLFVDRQFRPTENPDEYLFIPARVYDNAVLTDTDPGYVKMLENLPDNMRKAWLDGDWNVFDGQYFPEFNTDVHVIAPFEIPKHWVRYTAMDYGMDMLAQYWIAVDEQNNAYVYRELYKPGLIVSEAVAEIRKREENGEEIYTRIAPPDLWNTQSTLGKSTAILFEEAGLTLDKSNNDRIAGWMAVRELLKVSETRLPDGTKGKTARLKIFSTCSNLIRVLPLLQYDEKNVNDAAKDPHEITHANDALRYFAITWIYPTAQSETSNENELPYELRDDEPYEDFETDYYESMFYD